VLPERYSRVSKKHCIIERGIEGIQIIDLESTNLSLEMDEAAQRVR
jgi:hypothetical protein